MKKNIALFIMFFSISSYAQIGKMTTSERILDNNDILKIELEKEHAVFFSEITRYDKSSTIFSSKFSLDNLTAPGKHENLCGPALSGELVINTELHKFIKNVKVKNKEIFFYRPIFKLIPFSLIYQIIDSDGKVLIGSIDIPEIEKFKALEYYGDKSILNPVRFNIIVSKDEENIFIIYSQDNPEKTSEEDKVEQTILTLNVASMDVKHETKYSLNFDLVSTQLIPNYNNYLYTLIVVETPDTLKKMFNYGWIRDYKIIGLNTSMNSGRKDYEIELKNNKITDANFEFAENGDLIVAGLYKKPDTKAFSSNRNHGFFAKRIEVNSKQIIWENETPFNSAIVTATNGINSAKLEQGTSENFELMDFAFFKNGSICLIMEDRKYGSGAYLTYGYSAGFTAAGHFGSTPSFGVKTSLSEYGSIILANIDLNGETNWTRHIPKFQKKNLKQSNEAAIGYSYHVIDNKIQFVFTDSPRNYDKNSLLHLGKEAKGASHIVPTEFKGETLAMCEIDEGGTTRQRIIASNQGYGFISQGIRWTENNDEIILVSFKGWNKYAISKIKL